MGSGRYCYVIQGCSHARSLKSDVLVSSTNSLICIQCKPWLVFVHYQLAFVQDRRLSSQNDASRLLFDVKYKLRV